MDQLLSKFKGCILGGALGDALGYPIEFHTIDEIKEVYGEQGIENLKPYNDVALISDDTQMTLFTACGLLKGYSRFKARGVMGDWQDYVYRSYLDWRATQFESFGYSSAPGLSWLMNVQDLFSCRAPGNTCLNALESNKCGKTYSPINNGKGCGGVMRVSPVGLFLPQILDNIKDVDMLGAEVAAITHGNPLAYIPAAAFVHIVAKGVTTKDSLEDIVKDAILVVSELYGDKEGVDIFQLFMEKAVSLSNSNIDDLEAIEELGEGWLGLEALAISVYCALKYQDDFKKAIQVAVNHGGDSDSTGAITGNILGAYHGFEVLPEEWLKVLELRPVMEELAQDMYLACQPDFQGEDEIWKEKYIMGTFSLS